MEQHPVPQQISAYEFELVGDMTLKQFAQVAAGVVIALILYATKLPFYIKWPFIIISTVTGVMMAFVPLQERPLQTWIIAFIKAIYSPTQFLWEKKTAPPEFLVTKGTPVAKKEPITPKMIAGRQKLVEYLTTLPSQPSPLDQQEVSRLKKIDSLFSSTQLPPTLTPSTSPLPEKSMPAGVRIRRLHGPLIVEEERKAPSPPSLKPKPVPSPAVKPTPKPEKKTIPPLQKVRERKPAAQAKFSPEIPFPSTPTIPNILVGMVLDPQGKIIEAAILEIRDQEGNPVRALKTNKLGQFMIASPLANGTYEIETEKEGFQFETIKVGLTGKIVPPIEIRAREAKIVNKSSVSITNN